MSLESIALISGIVLIALACKMVVAIKAAGIEGKSNEAVHWVFKAGIGVLGLSLVLPYVFGSWLNVSRLFGMERRGIVAENVLVYFKPDDRNLNEIGIAIDDSKSFDLKNYASSDGRVLAWTFTANFEHNFFQKPSAIIPLITNMPHFPDNPRWEINADVIDATKYKISIRIWPENSTAATQPISNFSSGQLEKFLSPTFGVKCIVLE